jgi:hypothetical protein
MKRLVATFILLVALVGCTQPLEQTARDAIATASGAISAAQTSYSATCSQNSGQRACGIIIKAAAANNTAIDALQAYCGFSPTTPISAQCTPVKTAASALTSALNNLQAAINDLKAAAPAKTGGM